MGCAPFFFSSRRRHTRCLSDCSSDVCSSDLKEALCINCGCCVSECNSMESDPLFTGPQALAKGFRFVGDPRDGRKVERLEKLNGEHGIWDCRSEERRVGKGCGGQWGGGERRD